MKDTLAFCIQIGYRTQNIGMTWLSLTGVPAREDQSQYEGATLKSVETYGGVAKNIWEKYFLESKLLFILQRLFKLNLPIHICKFFFDSTFHPIFATLKSYNYRFPCNVFHLPNYNTIHCRPFSHAAQDILLWTRNNGCDAGLIPGGGGRIFGQLIGSVITQHHKEIITTDS